MRRISTISRKRLKIRNAPVLAGGSFPGMPKLIRKLPGVVSTRVG